LASLQAWCHWIARRPEKVKETLCQRCIDSCIWATTYTVSCDQPPPSNLIHSAVHLFQSITAILKPILWDQPTFRNLISMGTYSYLKPDTIKVLRRALVNGIILPLGDSVVRQRLLGKLSRCKVYVKFFSTNKKTKSKYVSSRCHGVGAVRASGYTRTTSAFRINNFDHDNATDSTIGRLRILIHNYEEDVAFVSRIDHK